MYFALYGAIASLPLATIAAGIYTAPLFVALLSAALVGEPVRRRGWLGIALGFAGVLLILKPGSEAFGWPMLLPVAGGLFYAVSALITRAKCRDVRPVSMALGMSLLLLAVGVAGSALMVWAPMPGGAPFVFGRWGVVDGRVMALVAMLAALMVGNGLVLPLAYQSAPTAIIAVLDYSYLIFATLFGLWVFGDVPDVWTLAGIGMIAAAGLMAAV